MSGWKAPMLGLVMAYAGFMLAAQAAEPTPSTSVCAIHIARIVAIQGEVRVRSAQQAWQSASNDQALCAGDELQVGAGARAALRLSDNSNIPLDQNTQLILRSLGAGNMVQIELLRGNINVATGRVTPIQILTPHGQLQTSGGDFAVQVTPQQTATTVFQGKVDASNAEGSLQLQSDESAFFAQLSAPRRDIAVKPRDMVQWVVQYPAILTRGNTQPAWAEAARAYEQGHALEALISLDQVPSAARSADYFVYRANLLLLAGRSDEAQQNIDSALKLKQDLADAWALQAIIDLGRNDPEIALTHANKAVALGPQAPAAYLAQSYALQANRQAPAALTSAQQMVKLAPDSALGHTRLAELELASGDRSAALASANRAVKLDPNLTDAQSILGFTALSLEQDDIARSAFETATKLNSADPRARMGLGLSRIHPGQLQAGREDLELAASLDPENALLRTYLGRAYAKEDRTQDAADQYARAKRSDPQDPTPYFFSALQLAESNRPVSAREELQEALSRNENRAVYRGQALLDEDAALRKANEVGVNRALGLDDSARAIASDALARAPNEAVLHRALGDSMATLSRSQPTRESEYLQALLRDPLNVLPTPLFLAESARSSTSVAPQHGFFQPVGAGQTGYNEFSAVFNPSRIRAQLDGTVAGQGSRGDQFLLAGVVGKVGVSLSQLHFKTDGFGEFDRLNNTIWQGAIQAELDTGTRLYAERRHYDSERREVLSPAQPFYFAPQQVDEQRQRSRLGLRQRLGELHEILLLNSWDDTKQYVLDLPTPFNDQTEPVFNRNLTEKVVTREAQYVFHANSFNLLLGSVKAQLATSNDFGGGSTNQSQTQIRATYVYARYALFQQLQVDVGLSKDRQEIGSTLRQNYTNPKIGVRWEPVPGGTLRLAKFNVVNHFLAGSATLEPTQVAGFNQFYSDGVGLGIRAKNRGLGWDQTLGHGFSYGLESMRRKLDVAVNNSYEVLEEHNRRLYLNWAVPRVLIQSTLPGWESSLSLAYDTQAYRRNVFSGVERIRDYTPRHLRLGANFAHSSGLSINFGVTKVRTQGTYTDISDLDFNDITVPFEGKFWVVDTSLVYRLPKQSGQIVFGAMNLTNRRGFQYLEIDPLNPRFAPERYVYGKFLLAF